MADQPPHSIEPQRRPKIVHWLFTPFVYVAGGTSLAIGVAAILLAGLLGSLSNTHFDGVLDMHTGRPAPTRVFLLEGLINWLCLAVVLFLLSRLVSRTSFRARDLFGTQAMARWPTVITALLTLLPAYQRGTAYLGWQLLRVGSQVQLHSADMVLFGLTVMVTVAAIVWMVALMYQSYSTCCNMKGAKAIATFVLGLLLAEVLSKVAIVKLLIM